MDSERPQRPHQHLRGVAGLVALIATSLALLVPTGATAASKPEIRAAWASEVNASSARLRAEIDPEGARTTYHFDYLTQKAYDENLAAGHEAFAGARKAPAGSEPSIGEGSVYVAVAQMLTGLGPATAYRYRLIATNTGGPSEKGPNSFTTQSLGGGSLLADGRSWEMVSPIDKNGGRIQGAGENYGGDTLQVAANGEAATYTSSASFGSGAGNPGANQYISRRSEAGWLTENITAPTLSGAYGEEPDGVPYRLFSSDLSLGLMLNGEHCRIETEEPCPVANPPLPGSGAPLGYQDYYLRNDASGAYASLLSAPEVSLAAAGADTFSVSLAGATPDLSHVVLSTCSKLTPEATQQPDCESGGPNLYEWSNGTLRLINRLGTDSQGTSDARLAAPSGAISADGQRIYFTVGEEAALYLREGEAGAKLVSELGSFQTASSDGSIAYYTKEEGGSGKHLYRYEAIGEHTTDLTPSGGVLGVLGASTDGSTVYYQDAAGLKQWHAGATTTVASGPDAALASDYPPTTGTARVSADGSELLFLSSTQLTGYDNTDPSSPAPCPGAGAICDSEVFLWSAAGGLQCVSCNPTAERPLGPSSIPGALANGTARLYKPRILSSSGRRVFFETTDALILSDTNKAPDVYQWEASGEGSCAQPGGCISLISSGRSAEGATFVDASAGGADAFFLTDGSLIGADPGSVDLYDARVGGGFPEPPASIPCDGDACQPLPSEPEDPEPGTEREAVGNPPLPKIVRCKKGFIRRHGQCKKIHKHHKHKKHRRHG